MSFQQSVTSRRQSCVFPEVYLSPPGGGNHMCVQQSACHLQEEAIMCVSSSPYVFPAVCLSHLQNHYAPFSGECIPWQH